MRDIKICSAGIDYRHGQEFEINRHAGSGNFLFIHFTTGIQILTEDGKVKGTPGCCIVYAPPFPQWYKGVGNGFANDWFHFEGADVQDVLSEYGIPRNRLFYPDNSSSIVSMLSEISSETITQMPFYREHLSLMAEELFLKLGRELKNSSHKFSGRRKAELYEKFRELRLYIGKEFKYDWTVKKAAEKVHLSPSRFSVLYKEFFGRGFISDLLHIRLEHARWLLTSTNISVNEVAAEAGFKNIHYFSRAFRKRFFSPPGKYYEKAAGVIRKR